MNISTEDVIRYAMREFNLTSIMVSPSRDVLLMLPEVSWIKEFSKWIGEARLSIPSYAVEKWDCDDYAMWASCEASLCRAAAPGNSGHSVFIAYITGNSGKELNGVKFDTQLAHACLLILDSTETWWFFEPQSGAYCNALENLVSEEHPYRSVASVDYLIV